MTRLVSSPCCNPEMGTEEVLKAYSGIGFRHFEVFTSWAKSAFDYHGDPKKYLDLGKQYAMNYVSYHLPQIGGDHEAGLKEAIAAARFAKTIGCETVLFKGTSRPNIIQTCKRFLDEAEALGLTTVVQNHAGSPISSPQDYHEVLSGVNDPRLKTVLEVGHFHTVGVDWRKGYELLKGTIALIHIKDQKGPVSVPYGTGEIDLPGLIEHMGQVGYDGPWVVEMEVEDKENTLEYLREALDYLDQHGLSETA